MKILFQAITGIQKGLNMVSAVIVGFIYFILNIGSTFAPIYFNQSSERARSWADSTYYSVDCFRFLLLILLSLAFC
jgi:hypothetical protein